MREATRDEKKQEGAEGEGREKKEGCRRKKKKATEGTTKASFRGVQGKGFY